MAKIGLGPHMKMLNSKGFKLPNNIDINEWNYFHEFIVTYILLNIDPIMVGALNFSISYSIQPIL